MARIASSSPARSERLASLSSSRPGPYASGFDPDDDSGLPKRQLTEKDIASGSAVRVFVRVRPLNARELALPPGKGQTKQRVCITMRRGNNSVGVLDPANGWKPRDLGWQFDGVLWSADSDREQNAPDVPFADQRATYDAVCAHLVENTFLGYNSCLFAYGQTGSGKTHTMMGPSLAVEADRGIIPRLCHDIHNRIQELQRERPECSFSIQMTYLEIYQEKVFDLLAPVAGTPIGGRPTDLRVRFHPDEGVFVDGLTHRNCHDTAAMLATLEAGNEVRHTAATKMNLRSSRSHAILTVVFQSIEILTDDQRRQYAGISTNSRRAKLNLVDLAGSERTSKSGAEGETLAEANAINLSLTTLGRVIDALADLSKPHRRQRAAQPPYRESLLTWILSDSLGGNSKTTMVATISPHISNADETMSTLRYASRAREIVNVAVRNEDPSVRRIRELQEEVERLKRQIAQLRDRNRGQGDEHLSELIDLRTENERLRAQVDSLKGQLEEERAKNRVNDGKRSLPQAVPSRGPSPNPPTRGLQRQPSIGKDARSASPRSDLRLKQADEEAEQLKKLVEKLQQKLETAQAKAERQAQKHAAAREADMEDLKRMEREMSVLQQRLKRDAGAVKAAVKAEKGKEALAAKHEAVSQELMEIRAERDQVQMVLSRTQSQERAQSRRVEELEERTDELSQEVAAERARTQQLRSRLAQAEKDWEHRLSALQSQAAESYDQVQRELSEQVSDLRQQLSAADRKREQQEDEERRLLGRAKAAEDRARELEREKADLARAARSADELHGVLEQQKRDLELRAEVQRQELEQLRGACSGLEGRLREAAEDERALAERLQHYEAQLGKRQQRTSVALAELMMWSTGRGMRAVCWARLVDHRARRVHHRIARQMRQLQDTRRDLTDTLERLERERSRVGRDLRGAEREREDLRQELRAVEEELRARRDASREHRTHLGRMEDELRQTRAAAERRLVQRLAEQERMQADLEARRRHLVGLVADVLLHRMHLRARMYGRWNTWVRERKLDRVQRMRERELLEIREQLDAERRDRERDLSAKQQDLARTEQRVADMQVQHRQLQLEHKQKQQQHKQDIGKARRDMKKRFKAQVKATGQQRRQKQTLDIVMQQGSAVEREYQASQEELRRVADQREELDHRCQDLEKYEQENAALRDKIEALEELNRAAERGGDTAAVAMARLKQRTAAFRERMVSDYNTERVERRLLWFQHSERELAGAYDREVSKLGRLAVELEQHLHQETAYGEAVRKAAMSVKLHAPGLAEVVSRWHSAAHESTADMARRLQETRRMQRDDCLSADAQLAVEKALRARRAADLATVAEGADSLRALVAAAVQNAPPPRRGALMQHLASSYRTVPRHIRRRLHSLAESGCMDDMSLSDPSYTPDHVGIFRRHDSGRFTRFVLDRGTGSRRGSATQSPRSRIASPSPGTPASALRISAQVPSFQAQQSPRHSASASGQITPFSAPFSGVLQPAPRLRHLGSPSAARRLDVDGGLPGRPPLPPSQRDDIDALPAPKSSPARVLGPVPNPVTSPRSSPREPLSTARSGASQSPSGRKDKNKDCSVM